MPVLSIYLDGEGMLRGVDVNKIVQLDSPIKIGALTKGMSSGRPSISFAFELPDGRTVFAQTSMRLFHIAAKAFAAKYGWQDDDKEGQERNG